MSEPLQIHTGPDWIERYAEETAERERRHMQPFIDRPKPERRPILLPAVALDRQQNRWYPQDIEAEQRILSLLVNNYYALHLVQHILDPADFYLPSHQKLYQFMCETITSGAFIDQHAFRQWLTALDGSLAFEEWGGWQLMATLQRGYLEYSNEVFGAQTLARRIRHLSQQRRAIDAADAIQDAASEDQWEPDQTRAALDAARSIIDAAEQSTQGNDLDEALLEAQNALDALYDSPDTVPGLQTGIVGLDRALGGLRPGRVYVVGARTKVGKSGFGFTIAHNIILKRSVNRSVSLGIISLEMPGSEIVNRLLSLAAVVDHSVFETGVDRHKQPPTEHEQEMIEHYRAVLSESPLYLATKRRRPDLVQLSVIERQVLEWRREHSIEFLILDHMHLVEDRRLKDQSTFAVTSRVARALKEIATEADIPLLALAQLNRAADNRPDPHPILSDFRATGEIEQSADVVSGIHRQGAHDPTGATPWAADLDILANRHGPTTRIALHFEGPRMQYYDISHRQED